MLQQEAERAWQGVLERADGELGAELARFAAGPAADRLRRVLGCSPFVADLCRRRPALLAALARSGQLEAPLQPGDFRHQLRERLAAPGAALEAELRRFRQWHMLRIVWRDFCRLADTLETVRDTSLLAEACISEALAHCQAGLEQRFGRPVGARSGAPQELIVIGMGKLGAGELNVSSDIDLIFAFPEAGSTEGGSRSISNEAFFVKLGQALINALGQVTADGFVFRVDMRLRPYGESGALAHSFAALEEYYQDRGATGSATP